MKRILTYGAAILFMIISVTVFGDKGMAKVDSERVAKLGTGYQIEKKGTKYKSSDTSVAYVDKSGYVTAKSIGTCTIKVTTNSGTWSQKLKVVKNGKIKKGVSVSTGEMNVVSAEVKYSTVAGDGSVPTADTTDIKLSYTVTATVKNVSSYDAKRVVLYGYVSGNDCEIDFGSVPGKEKKTVKVTGILDLDSVATEFEKNRIKVVSGSMSTILYYKSKITKPAYATPDKKAPVIKGFVGKNSYNQSIPYMVVYSNDKKYDYFKYVKATDDRDSKVKLTVDTSKVNFKKAGIYKIKYIAEDSAGNVAKKSAKIQVRKVTKLDKAADKVLKKIIKKSWSVFKKAKAIYKYTRSHVAYTGESDKSSWENEALNGLTFGTGDCFTYYSMARALLTRAGIPNIEVTRYKGSGHHWWNMVYVKGGWYHYDTCPRRAGGTFCMVTDAQLKAYTKKHGNSFVWNYKKIPKSAKKKLTKIW